MASRTTFHSLGALAAERLLGRDFDSQLNGMSANPAAKVASAGSVLRYLSDDRVLLRTPHGLRVDTSSVPLRTTHGGRSLQPVSLQLRSAGAEYSAVNPLQAVSVSKHLDGGLSVGSDGIRVVPQGSDKPGSLIGGQRVFFAGVGADEDVAIAPTIRGADISTVLRSRLSPEQVSYSVILPAGSTLQAAAGGAVIKRNDKTLATIPAPTARDAQGTSVPASMEVSGHQLILKILHRDRDFAYPILVDPEVITVSESAADWTFNGEGKGSGPGSGKPITIEQSGSYPRIYPCTIDEFYSNGCGGFTSAGEWDWKVPMPLKPATGQTSITAEFDDINLSSSVSPEEKEQPSPSNDVYWNLSVSCEGGHEAVASGYKNSPPPTNDAVTATNCAPGASRILQSYLLSGQENYNFLGYTPRLTVNASLSVGAVLVSETAAPPLSEPQSETFGTTNEGEPGRNDCILGEAVNCVTGNQVVSQSDLEAGGRGPALELSRTYNSRLAVGQARSGAFGYGWTSSYSAHIEAGEHLATVYQDNGSTVSFTEEAGGRYVATSPLVQAKLVREGSSYTYTLPSQTKLVFNNIGLLTSESDRNGNTITISYENVPCGSGGGSPNAVHPDGAIGGGGEECPVPRPQRVAKLTDSAGRSITFSYNTEGHITSATDPMGHTVQYEYEEGNLTSVTKSGESSPHWQFKYDPYHELTSQTEAAGHSSNIEYANYRVKTETDPEGHKRTWEYNGNEVAPETHVTEPNGSLTVMMFNAAYLPTSSTVASGTALAAKRTYVYNSADEIESTTDSNAHETKYGYDAEGNRTSETDALSNTTKWTYDATHDVSSTTAPNGETTTITRESRGNVTETSRPTPGGGTQTTKAEYDSHGDPTSETNPVGKTTKYEYNELGDRTSETNPEGNKSTATYNEDSQETSSTSPPGNEAGAEAAKYTTTIERGPQGQPLAVTEPPTGTSETHRHMEYLKQFGTEGSGNGQLASPGGLALDSKGDVWVADTKNSRIEEFNEKGEYLTKFGAKGTANGQLSSPSGIAIDSHGNVWVADTGNSRIEEFNEKGEYLTQFGTKGTANGQLSSPAGIAIDSHGNVWVADTKNSRIEEFNEKGEYQEAFGSKGSATGQLNEPKGLAVDTSGNIWVADTKNNRIEDFSTAGAFIQTFGVKGTATGQLSAPSAVQIDSKGDAWVADTGNNRAQEWVSGTTKYQYGANGDLEAVTAPNGQTTTYAYNADNQPIKVTGPTGVPEETTYNEAGLMESHTDSNGHKTTYVRNSLGQITEIIDPLGRKTKKTYDAAGNLASLTDDKNRTTTYTYDPDERLSKVSYSDGVTHNVEYFYGPNSERTSMMDGTGTTIYTYNQLSQLTESKDGHGNVVGYQYDTAGDLSKLTYPNGKSVERTFDSAGRMNGIKDWLGNTTTIGYNASSDPASITFPISTGEKDTYTYNPAGQMTGITFAKSTKTLASLTYVRNDSGQLTSSATKSLPGEESSDYSYDPYSRMTTAGAANYEYDAAGNPTKLGSTSNTFDAADELTAGAGTTYSYDEDGERTKATPPSGPATTYSYNQASELTSASRPEEGATPKIEDAYAYNGDGLRTTRTASGKTSYMTWQATPGLPLLLNDGTNSYIYGPEDLPIEQISSEGKVLYYHHDQQGSTRMLTGSTGKVEATFTYGAYGALAASTGTVTTPLGYDGQYTDADTGLIYLRARYYDPSTAQFISPDPLSETTLQPYTYAGDSPVNQADPTGKITVALCGGGSVAGFHLTATGSACLVKANEAGYPEQIGWTDTAGAGGASAGVNASLGAYIQVSNARRVGGLYGPFSFAAARVNIGEGASAGVFWSPNYAVFGIDLGISEGVGADASIGVTDTTAHGLPGLIQKLVKLAFEAHGEINGQQDLQLAATLIEKITHRQL